MCARSVATQGSIVALPSESAIAEVAPSASASHRSASDGPPRQRADPGSVDGEGRVPHQVLIGEPPQPLVDGLRPPVVMERQHERVEQAREDVHLSGRVRVRDRLLRQVVGDAPGHRPAVERSDRVRFAALELGAQQLAEEMVIAVPLALAVERDHEAVRALEPLELICRSCRLEHRIAQRAAHALQHRRVLEEARLLRRQPGQELEAEVVGDEAVVAGDVRDARRARRPRPLRQRREVQAGGPALRALGELGERRRHRGRFPRPTAAARPRDRPAGAPSRRSRGPVPAPASGRAATPAPPCSRSATCEPAGTYSSSAASTSRHARTATACRSSSTSTIGRSSAASALMRRGTRVDQIDASWAGQGLEHHLRDRFDAVHRGRDVAQQDDLVLAAVEGHPRERSRISRGPPCEQRRLAVARTRDHGHDRLARRAQSRDQVRLRDRVRPGHRGSELHVQEIERGVGDSHAFASLPGGRGGTQWCVPVYLPHGVPQQEPGVPSPTSAPTLLPGSIASSSERCRCQENRRRTGAPTRIAPCG